VVAFIGINKAVKPSTTQFFDLFHSLLYLAVTSYRNRFLVQLLFAGTASSGLCSPAPS
jgi:hypothetical protein